MIFTKRELFLLVRGLPISVFIDGRGTEFNDISVDKVLFTLIQDLKIGFTKEEADEFTRELVKEERRMITMAIELLRHPTNLKSYEHKEWV